MKRCPTCKRTFDDTLTYCLIDGSILDAPFDPNTTLTIPEPRQTEPPPTEVMWPVEGKEIPRTVASPAPRVPLPDEQKPTEFGKAQSDSSLPDSISLSKLGLAPTAGESSRRRGKLWLGIGVVIAFIVGLLIAVSTGLFSGGKRTANEPRVGTPLRNQMGMEFVYVPAGIFMMGSENGYDDEKPVHQVTIHNGFYMGKYEVTQAQWQKVMGNNPSYFKNCDQCPVENVSWNDAQEFIKKLNAQNDGYTYRLPSEAEWEYACRAGTTGDYAGDVDAMAWYEKNSDKKTHPVGQKQPNPWGLYDMHGNVWEWCEDLYHDSYNGAPMDGSAWESGGEQYRVLHGGSWYDLDIGLRPANRLRNDPGIRNYYLGLRVVAVSHS